MRRKECEEAVTREKMREERELEELFMEFPVVDVEFEIVAGNKVKNNLNPGKLKIEQKEKFLF